MCVSLPSGSRYGVCMVNEWTCMENMRYGERVSKVMLDSSLFGVCVLCVQVCTCMYVCVCVRCGGYGWVSEWEQMWYIGPKECVGKVRQERASYCIIIL